jgi:hypothetical protein
VNFPTTGFIGFASPVSKVIVPTHAKEKREYARIVMPNIIKTGAHILLTA